MSTLLARTHRVSIRAPADVDDESQTVDDFGRPLGPATPPTPSHTEVECNLQPLGGDVRQAAAGRQVGADWRGFFPPGTALLPDTLITATEMLDDATDQWGPLPTGHPARFRVTSVAPLGGSWDVEVLLAAETG